MTKEEKELLLKDLCGRLPYGVKLKCEYIKGHFRSDELVEVHPKWVGVRNDATLSEIGKFLPYLRPMSSMTEEEKKTQKDYVYHFSKNSLPDYEGDFVFENEVHEYLDWLNAHHLDYRGLIEKGLAIEAPEGMYN